MDFLGALIIAGVLAVIVYWAVKDANKQPKYCYTCGANIVVDNKIVGYNNDTGKPDVHKEYTCSKNDHHEIYKLEF